MADQPISGLTALTAAATGDLLEIVDVSDTTMAATGTNKKITAGQVLASGLPGSFSTLAASGNASLTTDGASYQWINAGNKCAISGIAGVMDFYVGTSIYDKKATLSSTGLAVTGAVSATGQLKTTGTGSIDNFYSGAAGYLFRGFLNGLSSNGDFHVYSDATSTRIGSEIAKNVDIRVNSAAIGTFSSTGLAVAGAVSGTKVSFGGTGNGTGGYFGGSGANYGTIQEKTVDSWSLGYAGNSSLVTTPVLTWTTAGVAVTGAVSATTTGKVGTTLGVGNATPSASGAGITFPAIQSASTDPNTLDDYEEGTWTPALYYQDATGVTRTYTAQTGTYTKSGNTVTVEATVTGATSNSGSYANDNIGISGLPFPTAGVALLQVFHSGFAGSATVGAIVAQTEATISYSYFLKQGSIAGNLADDFGAGATYILYLTGTYFV